MDCELESAPYFNEVSAKEATFRAERVEKELRKVSYFTKNNMHALHFKEGFVLRRVTLEVGSL